MRFVATSLPGVLLLEQKRLVDERGYFARTWCARELAAHGLDARLAQCNVSHNTRRGTLRGMHFQRAPYAEAKVVSCLRGAIYDVVVDLRPESPTFKRWAHFDLRADDGMALFVPAGFAHGFQTLEDDSIVSYLMSEYYQPEAAAGVRWNDPAFGIVWPDGERTVSERDQAFEDFVL